ncbi:MAG: signal peptidase II [Arsenophonus sp. ER-BJ3-MAG3]
MKNSIFSTGLFWLWLTILIFIADFSTKKLILNNFRLYETIPLSSYFNLSYVQNTGVAFGFLADEGEWRIWFFTFIAITICFLLITASYRQNINKKLSNIAYALVIGGALGNLSDRLIYGFVIDFIDFYIGDWHWPTFNIADTAISIGVILIIFDILIDRKNKVNLF